MGDIDIAEDEEPLVRRVSRVSFENVMRDLLLPGARTDNRILRAFFYGLCAACRSRPGLAHRREFNWSDSKRRHRTCRCNPICRRHERSLGRKKRGLLHRIAERLPYDLPYRYSPIFHQPAPPLNPPKKLPPRRIGLELPVPRICKYSRISDLSAARRLAGLV